MATPLDHDAYIAAAPEAFRPTLERLRAVLARTLPDAEEIVAYNMPGFSVGGTVVASYARSASSAGSTSCRERSPRTPTSSRPRV